MRWQTRILGTFLILISFSEKISSQNPLDKFKEKTDFYLLENFVSRTIDDSVLFAAHTNMRHLILPMMAIFIFVIVKRKKNCFLTDLKWLILS